MGQRILVIDDDPAITGLLRRGLSYEGYEVVTAVSGMAGLALARENPPDLVVLDRMMPGIDGMDTLRRLRAADTQLPILFLTAKDAPEDEVEGLQAGVDDYVVKPFNFEILLARIQALLRRQERERPTVLHFADLMLDPGEHRVGRGSRTITLTHLEFTLLQEFLRNPRLVLSKEYLLDRVWGYDFGGNTNVVEVYVKILRQKMEAAGEPRLLHTIRGAGYVLRED